MSSPRLLTKGQATDYIHAISTGSMFLATTCSVIVVLLFGYFKPKIITDKDKPDCIDYKKLALGVFLIGLLLTFSAPILLTYINFKMLGQWFK